MTKIKKDSKPLEKGSNSGFTKYKKVIKKN